MTDQPDQPDQPDRIEPPAALVLGCNTPHGIGVLSDWIEEQTGHAPDFHGVGWSESFTYHGTAGCGHGELSGDGYGDGALDGFGDGYGDGSGCGDGYGNRSGQGNGCGHGNWCGGGTSYATTEGA